ncbi:MAG: hypothetical protein VYC40_04130 [Pseudomonadota bacterium]|jgi:hypothetical protein|nr:hypothetical protein [Pseudomonadota bacterium]|tara:strand:- start:875 stop:1519 length:645 start_codon:yes stop_codon:yes gene_type:complete
MSFTLATLKTAIQDYLEVSESTFTTQLPTFIQESEDRIFSFVQLPEQRKNVQGTLTTGNRFLATPTDFYAPMSLALISSSTYDYLDFKHPSFIKEYSSGTTRSTPKYYSLFDDAAFEVSPIPDADYTVELHYLHKPVSLTAGSDSGTTFLSTDYSDALLYGSLVEGAIFLKEPADVIAQLEGRFKEAIARMKNTSEGRGTRDEYRYDSVRSNVS